MKHIMSRALASKTIKHYLCSACYGHLLEFPDGNDTRVECHRCGEDTPGFVTKFYVEKRRSESGVELLEVVHAIPTLNPHHGKDEEQLLSELGF